MNITHSIITINDNVCRFVVSGHLDKSVYDEEVSYASCYFNNTDNVCMIINLHTIEKHRGYGYGYKILEYIKRICIERNIQTIELDDCTDLFGQDNNIYLKAGFKYKEENQPEMKLLLM